jgi:hypothetical protein
MPWPLERFYRDARAQRISGGIDFILDYWMSKTLLFTYFYPEPAEASRIGADEPAFDASRAARLSPRNREHLVHVARRAKELARVCLALSRAHPDPAALHAKEHVLIQVSAIARELTTMALTLAYANHLLGRGEAYRDAQVLADVYCTEAREREDGHFRALTRVDPGDPDRRGIAERVVASPTPWLESDVVE